MISYFWFLSQTIGVLVPLLLRIFKKVKNNINSAKSIVSKLSTLGSDYNLILYSKYRRKKQTLKTHMH